MCDEWEIMLQFRLQMAQCVQHFGGDFLNVGKQSRSPFHTLLCQRDNISSNDFSFHVAVMMFSVGP